MKKILSVILVLCFALSLSGCREIYVNEKKLMTSTIENFIEAVDNRDSEALKAMLSPETIKKSPNIDREIEELFSLVPEKIISYDSDFSVASSESTRYGVITRSANTWTCIFTSEGNYYISFELLFRNDEEPEETGVTRLWFMSEKYMCSGNQQCSDEGFEVQWEVEEEFETKRIGGFPKRFTPFDRTITEEDIIAFLEKSVTVEEFKEHFGEPNCATGPYILTYQLADENKEERFANIYADNKTHLVKAESTEIFSNEDWLYDLIEEEEETK